MPDRATRRRATALVGASRPGAGGGQAHGRARPRRRRRCAPRRRRAKAKAKWRPRRTAKRAKAAKAAKEGPSGKRPSGRGPERAPDRQGSSREGQGGEVGPAARARPRASSARATRPPSSTSGRCPSRTPTCSPPSKRREQGVDHRAPSENGFRHDRPGRQGALGQEPVPGEEEACAKSTSRPRSPRRAATRAPPSRVVCSPNGVKVYRALCARFPNISSFGGRRPANGGFHPSGRAVDAMIDTNNGGWEVARWVRANASRLGVSEVIHAQSIWTVQRSGEGWRGMSDRATPPPTTSITCTSACTDRATPAARSAPRGRPAESGNAELSAGWRTFSPPGGISLVIVRGPT